MNMDIFYLFSCGSQLRSCETVPTVAAVRGFCRVRGVPKVFAAFVESENQTKWRTTESDEMSVNFKCRNK